jgi:hypothetical protein
MQTGQKDDVMPSPGSGSQALAMDKMLAHLPGVDSLNEAAIQAATPQFPGPNITLAAPLTVAGRIGGITTVGNNHIEYHIVANDNQEWLVGFNEAIAACGDQTFADAKEALAEFHSKLANDLMPEGEGKFDQRALLYMLGYYCGRCAFGQDDEPPVPVAPRITWLAENAGAIGARTMVIAPAMWQTANEFVTLIAITSLVGVDRWVTLTQHNPPGGGVLTGYTLVRYCLRLYAIVMDTADRQVCGPPHCAAFFRGLMAALTVHGHNDEGGYLRNIMRVAEYPPPMGIVMRARPDEFMRIPTRRGLTNDAALRFVLAQLLIGIRCISLADEGANVGGLMVPTMCERHDDGDVGGVVDDYAELRHILLGFVPRFERVLGQVYGLNDGSFNSAASYISAVNARARDRHLGDRWLTALYLVDPAGLSVLGREEVYGCPTGASGEAELPMWEGAVYAKSETYREAKGMAARGSKVAVALRNTTMRRCGINYLLHPGFNQGRDGLGSIAVVSRPAYGYGITDWVNCDNTARTVAGRRWSLVDSPLPHPSECIIGPTGSMLIMMYDGTRRLPAFGELSETVSIALGPMFVVQRPRYGASVTAKTVPPQLRNMMAGAFYGRDGVTVESAAGEFPSLPYISRYVPYNPGDTSGDTHYGTVVDEPTLLAPELGEYVEPTREVVSRDYSSRGARAAGPSGGTSSTPRFVGSGKSGTSTGGQRDTTVRIGGPAQQQAGPPAVPPPPPGRPPREQGVQDRATASSVKGQVGMAGRRPSVVGVVGASVKRAVTAIASARSTSSVASAGQGSSGSGGAADTTEFEFDVPEGVSEPATSAYGDGLEASAPARNEDALRAFLALREEPNQTNLAGAPAQSKSAGAGEEF